MKTCSTYMYKLLVHVLFLPMQSSDRCVCIWDSRSGQCVMRFEGHECDVNAVRFVPTGEAIGTACNDGTVRVMILPLSRSLPPSSPRLLVCSCQSSSPAFSHPSHLPRTIIFIPHTPLIFIPHILLIFLVPSSSSSLLSSSLSLPLSHARPFIPIIFMYVCTCTFAHDYI